MIGEFRQTRRELIRVFLSHSSSMYLTKRQGIKHKQVKLTMCRWSCSLRFMKLRQNSQKNSFGQSLYSGGKGEKYHVSISYLPSSIFAIFFTFVNSSCSRKLAASSSSCPCYQNDWGQMSKFFFGGALNAQRDNASTNIQIINLHVTFKWK